MAADNEINEVTLFASAARTATVNGTTQTNRFAKGIVFTVDSTAVGVTPSTVFTLQGQDPVSLKWYTILASAAVTTVATTTYTVFPGAPATANVSANFQLPRTWRLIATHGNATTHTYSVGGTLLY